MEESGLTAVLLRSHLYPEKSNRKAVMSGWLAQIEPSVSWIREDLSPPRGSFEPIPITSLWTLPGDKAPDSRHLQVPETPCKGKNMRLEAEQAHTHWSRD